MKYQLDDMVGKGYQMYLPFKKAFEPLEELHEIVDTCKDIVPQVQKIVKQRSMGKKHKYNQKGVML